MVDAGSTLQRCLEEQCFWMALQDLSQDCRLKTLVSLLLPRNCTILLIICDLISDSICKLTRCNSSLSKRSIHALFNLAHRFPLRVEYAGLSTEKHFCSFF